MSARRPRLLPLVALLAAAPLGAADPAPSPAVRWSAVNEQPAAWYASADARRIAASVVTHQHPGGGWPKNTDLTQPRPEPPPADPGRAANDRGAATIDNGGTTTPIEFLARVHSASPDEASASAARRGIDYLLEAQYSNGGWPQFFPLRKGYYSHITYNDNATANVLGVLKGVRDASPPYAWVDAARRARARSAIDRAVECILRTQVRQDGELTAWCAQHDVQTLEPAWARNFEPPSLSGNETVGLVRFLMSIEQPSAEVVAAIEAAVAWLEAAKVTGLRLEVSTGADGQRDRRAVVDPNAAPLWARFYELGTNRPIFLGRDRVVRYDYNEIERERRVGYAYLGDWPRTLLERDYPRWRTKQGR